MPDSSIALSYVLDIPALKSWADAAGNESQTILDAVKAGTVVIYNRIWDSAKDAYPDECKKIPKDDFDCHKCGEEHRLASAAVADKLRATFPIRSGAYDDAIEWAVVGIALNGPHTIVTDKRRKLKYEKINGLSVITYDELINQL